MKKQLAVVIPVYNEEARLDKTFRALKSPSVPWGIFGLEEIIFVNDGSKDHTKEMIKAERSKLEKATGARVRLISYKHNRGKGHAVKTGMLASKSEYTLMMDADISTPLSELERFQVSAKKERAVIIGTRKSRVVRVEKEQTWLRRNMGKVFTLLSKIILSTWVSDFTCGFKMFRLEANREIFSRSVIERWGYDSEILFLAKNLGYPIREVSVRWINDERSKVSLIKDAWRSLTELIKIRYNQVNGTYDGKRFEVRKMRFASR